MTQEQKCFVTHVIDVDGAIAVDMPPELFKKLNLLPGATLCWTFNDDGSVTISRIYSTGG